MNSGPDLNSRKDLFADPHNLLTFAEGKQIEVLSHIDRGAVYHPMACAKLSDALVGTEMARRFGRDGGGNTLPYWLN